MKIRSAQFTNFTVFEDAKFEFCPGVNVLIGPNGVGKTHVLKALYHMQNNYVENDGKAYQRSGGARNSVFLVESPSSLIRNGTKSSIADWTVQFESGASIQLFLFPDRVQAVGSPLKKDEARPLFLPPREALSTFPGFAALYERYKISIDSTYYHLTQALALPSLRQVPAMLADLMAPLEKELRGKILLKDGRFFIQQESGEMEIARAAEGHRKLATILQLINNGALEPGTCLCWDEPEANLNPKLVVLMKDLLLGLARAGVQIFIASHDYLLTRELSLASEYGEASGLVKFFGLSQSSPEAGVTVESGETLADLEQNPIVEEFAAHYSREAALFARSQQSAKDLSANKDR